MFAKLFCFLSVFFLSFSIQAQEAAEKEFYRNFWYPTYHGKRLNYCSFKGKCGQPVATRYCQMLGYKDANKQVIDYNVGLTNFLGTRAECRGWRCSGFKLITCVGKIGHKPAEKYYYRYRRFPLPRFQHYRVDWCYKNGTGCGQRAAYSYCRMLGYSKTKDYKIEPHVPATKALGNQRLCFGNQCNGFSYISCYR
ncbi:Uncharacterised protein (plasmid) [Legionella adelaidensis]|uniref:Uncharacterized protein n=1 Tax=Legionella adelaidensis TaxID=45056 RepID=A0A0W0R4D8_9GAMM|nr:hypothetical protein [Legionella adelaidensis]KTC65915.1 hypothetical protein Lade_0573 [Legionella adelaidensis]VEH85535.1 Uncharacterised protein [Legionella adelaidensis]